jgi:hypothetical protein
MYIHKSVDKCIHIQELFSNFDNVMLDYESDYDELSVVNFENYDICIYTLNNDYVLEHLEQNTNVMFIASDDGYSIPENAHFVKELMNVGFDMYITGVLDSEIIGNLLCIYKLTTNKCFI